MRLRQQLTEVGQDAGADHHLAADLPARHHATTPSRATINRILVGSGAVIPERAERPEISCLRFEAEQPNET